jgi:hypothetical protein
MNLKTTNRIQSVVESLTSDFEIWGKVMKAWGSPLCIEWNSAAYSKHPAGSVQLHEK